MYEDVIKALLWGNASPDVHVALLGGLGTYYSSGNDLGNFAQSTDLSIEERVKLSSDKLYRFVDAFVRFKKPLIAAVNGPAIGVAVTTLGLCDVVYAHPSAWFQTPFSALGQSPEGCSSYVFPQIMGPGPASEVLMMGRKLSATEAVERRLVTRILPIDDHAAFVKEATGLAAGLAALPFKSLLATKRLCRDEAMIALLDRVNRAECTILEERWYA
jgi:peroxisomal 3,2-trans-enoyl-CoA isomerase